MLVHANGAVDTVVRNQDDDVRTVLNGRSKLLDHHLQATVTGQADNVTIWRFEFGSNRRRQSIAHRAGGRRKLRAPSPVAIVAMEPGSVIAGAIGEDRIVREHPIEVADHTLHAQITGRRLRFLPGLITATTTFDVAGPVSGRRKRCVGQRDGHRRWSAGNRNVGMVDTAKLISVGMNMDERLMRLRWFE